MTSPAPVLSAFPATSADLPILVTLDDSRVLLFGATAAPLPGRTGTDGRFATLSWPTDEGAGHWQLALLQAPGIGRDPQGAMAAAHPAAHAPLPVKMPPWTLLSLLKEGHAAALPDIVDFLADSLCDGGDPLPPPVARILLAFVQAASRAEGFAELLGPLPGTRQLVQGWSVALPAPGTRLLVETETCRLCPATLAVFARGDLAEGARGLVAVLEACPDAAGAIRRLHFRAPDGWCRLELFENRVLLPDDAGPGYLRAMLPQLDGPAAALRTLRRHATAGYDGRDTVSELALPVRIALDHAVRVPGTGLLLSGWLLDPAGLVTAVDVAGPDSLAAIDGDWHKISRPDVTESFQADPLFAGRLCADSHRHGFLAFAPEPAGTPADAVFHLELSLADGAIAYLPLATARPTPAVLRRLLHFVNPDDPAAETLVARHMGPILRAAGLEREAAAVPAYPLGRRVEAPQLSVLLAVTDGREDIDGTLARFAVDPDAARVEILVAASAGASERLGLSLRNAASFYSLDLRFLPVVQAADRFAALAAALPHARAEQVLFLDTAVLPTRTGWMGEMARAARAAGRPALLSPTLLYEDDSIRFAGFDDTPAGPLARHAGYRRDWVQESRATPVDAVTADCMLLPRRLFQEMGGFRRDLAGADMKALDFCRRWRAAGHLCLWLPAVTLTAVDDGPPHPAPWERAEALLDRWSLHHAAGVQS